MTKLFYICELRPHWNGNRFVTFWRPNNCGYAYPLSWSGKYTLEEVEEGGTYYWKPRREAKKAVDRFPVPCDIVDALAVEPMHGLIDGDAGPVVMMTPENRRKLRKAAYRPKTVTDAMERIERGLE